MMRVANHLAVTSALWACCPMRKTRCHSRESGNPGLLQASNLCSHPENTRENRLSNKPYCLWFQICANPSDLRITIPLAVLCAPAYPRANISSYVPFSPKIRANPGFQFLFSVQSVQSVDSSCLGASTSLRETWPLPF